MGENRFQIDMATGRFTLPVVILICLILWGITCNDWSDLASLAAIIACGYLMIEMNTTFTLIRTRTMFPVCIYWYLTSIFFFLHPFEWSNLTQLAFLLAVFQLFLSYESNHAPTHIFHAFLFIGAGSMAFPQLIYYTPLFALSTFPFRAMNAKSFFSALLGLITPYWFLFGYAFFFDKMHLFHAPVKEMLHIYPIEYSTISPAAVSAGIFSTLLLAISAVHYFQVAYLDKTRARINLSFLVYSGLWTTLFMILQPQHLHELLPIQLICTSILAGHLFTLTRNRFSNLLFIVTFAITILLSIYNLWMQFFSF